MNTTERVQVAAREYQERHTALREFEEEHADVMSSYRDLVAAREASRERLVGLVAETGIAAAGMKVTTAQVREFNGRRLYDLLFDDPMREELVEVVYKVRTAEFDQAVHTGRLEQEVAKAVVEKVKQQTRVLNKPAAIQLG